ncbi:MAG: hypothetical protein ABFS46_19400 [Myxococcota bacterium]
MRPRSLLAAFVVLAVVGLLLREDPRRLGATSFGQVPSGQGALFELWQALGLFVPRSYEPPELLPVGHSIWWIEPSGLCDAPASGPEDDAAADSGPGAGAGLAAFVEAGGTAVILLAAGLTLFGAPGREPAPTPCPGLAGLALPARDLEGRPDAVVESEEAAEGEDGVAWPAVEEDVVQTVEGDLLPAPRQLEMPRLVSFAEAGGWRVRARVEGRPLVLERSLGQGRLVVGSDASFTRNRWLGAADAAPLVMDLVRAYGIEGLDERAHGLRFPARDLPAVLAGSAAMPVFAGVVLLGALVFWRGTARPAPIPEPPDAGAPTLDEFVDSLAGLYGRSRDHPRLAERYREVSLARLRRKRGLPADTSGSAVLERLRRQGRLDAAALAELAGPASASSAAELRRRFARFDALVEEGGR